MLHVLSLLLFAVSVGDAFNVWAVNSGEGRPCALCRHQIGTTTLLHCADSDIFRWTGSAWAAVPGKLKRVSVSAGGRRVVGVNAAGEVFVWLDGREWVRIPGKLANIDVSDTQIVGANAAQEIFHVAL